MCSRLCTVIDEYFKYKVTTSVQVFTHEFVTVVTPLSFTFCVAMYQLVDHRRQDYRQLRTRIMYKENVTIRDLLNNLPYECRSFLHRQVRQTNFAIFCEDLKKYKIQLKRFLFGDDTPAAHVITKRQKEHLCMFHV